MEVTVLRMTPAAQTVHHVVREYGSQEAGAKIHQRISIVLTVGNLVCPPYKNNVSHDNLTMRKTNEHL